jgi:hypothetical protein
MDISVEALQEALAIRRQIDALEKRLSSILGVSAPGRPARKTRIVSTTKKGGLTPSGRRRLSQLMKARWAARRKAAGGRAGAGPGPGRWRLVRS